MNTNNTLPATPVENALSQPARRLCEVVADIAFLAGAKRYHSGDSREDVQHFIEWAAEFERVHASTAWGTGEDDYLIAVEAFALAKMNA